MAPLKHENVIDKELVQNLMNVSEIFHQSVR